MKEPSSPGGEERGAAGVGVFACGSCTDGLFVWKKKHTTGPVTSQLTEQPAGM